MNLQWAIWILLNSNIQIILNYSEDQLFTLAQKHEWEDLIIDNSV
jgi:hypothetical protein